MDWEYYKVLVSAVSIIEVSDMVVSIIVVSDKVVVSVSDPPVLSVLQAATESDIARAKKPNLNKFFILIVF